MIRRLFASLALLIALPVAAAPARPVVLELFTSEGCSSCPPADAYLSQLSQRSDVLPLAFHVTYWNNLGWKDPYSLDLATQRQAAYGQRFGDGSYTPELVVDGASGVVGSDQQSAEAAIRKAAADSGATAAAVTAARHGNVIDVTVGNGSGSARVLLVGYDAQHVTSVGRGENSGRTLKESNIVRSFQPIGQWSGKTAAFNAPVPAGEQQAVLLEAPDGHIVGAARVSSEP
jgi:hypothetical protein